MSDANFVQVCICTTAPNPRCPVHGPLPVMETSSTHKPGDPIVYVDARPLSGDAPEGHRYIKMSVELRDAAAELFERMAKTLRDAETFVESAVAVRGALVISPQDIAAARQAWIDEQCDAKGIDANAWFADFLNGRKRKDG